MVSCTDIHSHASQTSMHSCIILVEMEWTFSLITLCVYVCVKGGGGGGGSCQDTKRFVPWIRFDRLLVNRLSGYQVSDENGFIVMKGGWPRKDATPVV